MSDRDDSMSLAVMGCALLLFFSCIREDQRHHIETVTLHSVKEIFDLMKNCIGLRIEDIGDMNLSLPL